MQNLGGQTKSIMVFSEVAYVHRPRVAAIPLRSNAGSLSSRAYSACLRTFENLWRVV